MVLTNRRGAKEEQRTDAVGNSDTHKEDSQRKSGMFLRRIQTIPIGP